MVLPNKDGLSICPERLRIYIDEIIQKEGYITHEANFERIETEGNSYFSNLYNVHIKGNTKQGESETNLFVKEILTGNGVKDHASLPQCFDNESFFYNELSKVFNDMQEQANIAVEDRFKILKSYDETNRDFIIMENIAKKEFKTVNKLDIVTLNFAEKSMEQLAKLHALSFALEKNNPNYYEEKIKKLKSIMLSSKNVMTFPETMTSKTIRNIEDKDIRKKVQDYVPTALDKYLKYVNPKFSPVNCLCHGDFRPNNIMMKENNQEIQDLVIIDYQFLYYGCPVDDILYYLFFATDQKFRQEHLPRIKDVYYSTFERFLKYFDIEAADVFTRETFEAEFKKRSSHVLNTALFFSPMIFACKGELLDVSETPLGEWQPKFVPEFQDRLKGILDDFIE